jgi:CheY-like chemotaxis protein
MINFDGRRILVVDDEPFMRLTIRTALRAIGHFDVADADDGDVALVQVDSFKPEIVLCDIAMPRMGGLQFVEQLRKHPEERMRRTPVLILTGYAEKKTVLVASRLQISGYLIKPVSPKLLCVRLQSIFAE